MAKFVLTAENAYELFVKQNKTLDELANIASLSKSQTKYFLDKHQIRKWNTKTKQIDADENQIIQDYINNNNSISFIKKKYNIGEFVLYRLFKKHNLVRERARTDICGRKFGHLEVIKNLHIKKHSSYIHQCKCECGKIVEVPRNHLISGNTKSCGCKRNLSNSANGNWSGYEGISGKLWKRIASNANIRNIEFSITIDYIWDLFLKQEKKCALSGLDLMMRTGDLSSLPNVWYASLDRIDSSKGYTEGNVHWVCSEINMMKQSMSVEKLQFLCGKIASHNNE